MTTLLQLKQGDSGTTLSLNVVTTGFQLTEDGWYPVVATPVHMGDPSPVLETLSLLLSNTSYDNIATNMQSLHEMQVLADRYINDPTQDDPVWLHAQMDGESNERRALVRRIEVQYKPRWFGAGESTLNIPLVLTVLRGPYWESTTVRNLPDSGTKTAACVVYDYTAAGDVVSAHDIVGDMGARIRLLDIYSVVGDNLLTDYWLGIRSANKRGATGISNFVNIWECEDGTNDTDATDTADASFASGGNYVNVSESSRDWDKSTNGGVFFKVLDLRLDDVTANPGDNLGNFLWILRARIGASTTWEVKLRFSYLGDSYNYIESPIIEIPAESPLYRYFEMGIFPIGLRDRHSIITSDVAESFEDSFTIGIYARRTSGTGDAGFDCLIPIPADEGFAKLKSNVGNLDSSVWIGRSPEGILKGVFEDSTNPEFYAVYFVDADNNFYLPPGDGRIYCIYFSPNGDINDSIIFNDGDTGRYYERWLSLRGSE